mmetsp:Transcript_37081/g.100040  ORF Transcript_37081/g.100040 Transcript_37081/m.100040 type:complete len:208 (-) Transcript_37081:111-734(-)
MSLTDICTEALPTDHNTPLLSEHVEHRRCKRTRLNHGLARKEPMLVVVRDHSTGLVHYDFRDVSVHGGALRLEVIIVPNIREDVGGDCHTGFLRGAAQGILLNIKRPDLAPIVVVRCHIVARVGSDVRKRLEERHIVTREAICLGKHHKLNPFLRRCLNGTFVNLQIAYNAPGIRVGGARQAVVEGRLTPFGGVMARELADLGAVGE